MERREEENRENKPSNTKEVHTHDIPDPGNSESDETAVTDPAVHAGENGTAVVSNEVPEESDPAKYATGHDTIPPEVLVKTDTSKSKREPDPGSSSNVSEQIDNPPTQDATVDDKIRSEAANKIVALTSSDPECSPLGSKPGFDQDTRRPADPPHADHKEPVANKNGEVNATQKSDSSSKGTEPKTKEDLQVTEHDNGASQLEGDEGPEEAAIQQLLTKLYYTKSPEEDEKQNTERGDCDVPDSVKASVPSLYDSTSASGTSEHSQNLDADLQVTEHDNGASQLEGDEGPEEAAIQQLLTKLYYTKSPKGPGTTPDMPKETSKTMSSENGSTTLPTTDSPGQALKLKANEKVQMSNDETPAATDTPIITSEKTGNTNVSRSEDNGSSSGKITGELFSSRSRKITVTLMTSSQLFTIEGLEKKFKEFKQMRSNLLKEVRVLQLPYSRIQYYTFMEPVDVMILCHSIENRRFTITNVTDSLYDAFLDYCNKKLGKERIVVIAHDFPPEEEKVRKTKMDTFKHTQWSTFENAGLVMICGMMNKEPEIKEQDWDSLVKFLEAASKCDPADTSPAPPTEKHTQPSPSKPSKSETANKKNGKSSKMLPGLGKAFAMRSRKPVIYVCTSLGLNSVRGFKEHLQALISRSFVGCEIREQELPYCSLKDFKFLLEVDKRDAMILCHSVYNRGFLVTDVPNSIYDEYLTYCKRLFGKDHVAVIVHDFEYPIEILKVHIDTFRRGQPKTFKLAKFIALAGRLDIPNVQLVHDDSQNLEKFVKGLR